MSEAPLYLILAQLNSLMTGSLRLTLCFGICWLLAALLSLWQPRFIRVAHYFTGWWGLAALLSVAAALAVKAYLNYPNPFVEQGFVLALCCLAILPLLWGAQAIKLWQHKVWRAGFIVVFGGGLFCALFWPQWGISFSRSDKVFYSTLMALPMALVVSYFPLLLAERLPKALSMDFHRAWALSAACCLGLHYFWLYPILKQTSPFVEFYPYTNLYDWFLFVFMILYLGNLYIDYWLKLASKSLSLSWNYLILLCALLCLWLNTNIFDTLAL